jgi:hypothetical protein
MAENTEILSVCLNKAQRQGLETVSYVYGMKPSQIGRLAIQKFLEGQGVIESPATVLARTQAASATAG